MDTPINNTFCPYTSPITVASTENSSLDWYCGVNCSRKCVAGPRVNYQFCSDFRKAETERRELVSLVVNL